MARGRTVRDIEITVEKIGDSPELTRALFVKGRLVKASQAQIAILAHLYDEVGYVVSYQTLCAEMLHKDATAKRRHVLRQHVLRLRRILRDHKANWVIAVVGDVGYTLCQLRK